MCVGVTGYVHLFLYCMCQAHVVCVRVKAKAVLHNYGSLPPPLPPLGYVEDGVLVVYVIACVYDGIASVS